MHLVILHGYVLRGTGSNIYSTNVAKSWRSMGHAITIVCQELKPDTLDYVDEYFIGTENIPKTAPSPGNIRVVVPDIDKLLLVYVYNKYEGFTVKELRDPSCSLEEIENHIEKTAAGLRKVLEQGADRVLSNHTLLSPVIAKRASQDTGVAYDVKVHGSAITYALKVRPELMKYAVEGLKYCDKIVAGTSYISKLLEETFADVKDEIQLGRKTVIIPPGMDPDVFQLLGDVKTNQENFLSKVKEFISRKPGGRHHSRVQLPADPAHQADLRGSLISLADSYDQWAVDSDLPERWQWVSADEPIICYFGAYLNTKGIGEILAGFSTILDQIPKARLFVMGYGSYREQMEGMLDSLVAGDVESFIAFAQAGGFVDATSEQLRGTFRKMSPEERKRIMITGMLEHSQLREILPLVSVVIVSTKCAEAFGMVLVEAMSSGVFPVANYHSGITDVLDVVKRVDPSLEDVMHMEVHPGGKHGQADGAHMIADIPKYIMRALSYLYPNGYSDNTQRAKVANKLRSISIEYFSWSKICKSLSEPLHK